MQFTARIDRPMGSCHPKHPDLVYTVNYGEIPGILAADGDPQDVYVLGVDEPLESFTGEVIAVIRRRNDVEDKWVMAPAGVRFTAEEIMEQVRFQEQYFDSYVVLGDAPLVTRRVDESLMDAALAIRMDCLREVCGYAADHAFPPEFIRETADFLRTADQTTLLMMDGGTPIACATLCYKRCIPTPGHPTGKRAHLMNVYTAPGCRRRGLASRLLTMLHREAERRGVTEITLDATDAGRQLYESMGYAASDECMVLDIGR
ncbi:MAG: GNAT family N-acetyltransferase [Clostridia bacterium]|nr:GNAT family N-acetyltransferase [Clostridia bacterium]